MLALDETAVIAVNLDHTWVVLGGVASALVVAAALRKVQLAVKASPRFARFQAAMTSLVNVFRNPEGSRTERLINALKTEILDKIRDMGATNDLQHAAVGERIAALTTEVAGVKERLTAVERKLP